MEVRLSTCSYSSGGGVSGPTKMIVFNCRVFRKGRLSSFAAPERCLKAQV